MMQRERMKQAVEAHAQYEQPSGAYAFMVEVTSDYRAQLKQLLPGRHKVCDPVGQDDNDLRSVVLPDAGAASIAKMIFSEDGLEDEGRALSLWDEHGYWMTYGPWPWEIS